MQNVYILKKVKVYSFSQTAYLNKLRGASEDVGSVIRSIFTDDLLAKYNWEGRWEKHALVKLSLFDRILRGMSLFTNMYI